jgi:hypothetical protein
MARYQRPPDPRDPDGYLTQRRQRRQRRDSQEPIPWRWLAMGVVVTAVSIVIALALARYLLLRPPLPTSPLEPTIIVLTAPPSPIPTETPAFATPTAIPTFTPVATPDVAEAPAEVAAGYYARVAGTGGVGVTIRGGPSTNNVAVTVAQEGALLFVVSGPEEGSDYFWWQVRLEDGSEGWVAAEFLEPATAPEE